MSTRRYTNREALSHLKAFYKIDMERFYGQARYMAEAFVRKEESLKFIAKLDALWALLRSETEYVATLPDTDGA